MTNIWQENGRIRLVMVVVFAAGLGTAAWVGRPVNTVPAGLFPLLLSPESLTLMLGGLLAVLFDWFPGLAPWYDALSRLKKQQLMIFLLGLMGSAVFAGTCWGWFESGLLCSRQSLPLLLQYVLGAAGVNQAVHLLSKP